MSKSKLSISICSKVRLVRHVAPAGLRGSLRTRAFSMAEVLVAMAVLSLITLMVAQLVTSSGNLALGSRKRLDAESQARLVLSRIGDDLARMVQRSDADCLFATAPGNDAIYFYSEAPAAFGSGTGTADKSSVALVGYRIATAPSDNENRLERLSKGLKWSGSASSSAQSIVLVTTDASGMPVSASRMTNAWAGAVGTSPSYRNGTDTTYQLLADGVIRLEVAFLTTNGTVTQDPQGTGSGATTSLGKVSAIIVTIAVLDETSQKYVDKTKLTQIAAALSDPTQADFSSSPPLLVAKKWQNQLNSGTFATTTGIPTSVAAQIRVYQRIFPLSTRTVSAF
ncbi:MAG: type II secretion system protein J [Candidatus Methylacidiphilales bacterium]|nr:hypothetical protein [Candidatus Methylacidiphilales bacterium]